jgi:hypothetical protein
MPEVGQIGRQQVDFDIAIQRGKIVGAEDAF